MKYKSIQNNTQFTKKEKVILEVLALGKTNKEIAGKLNLSENTIKTHLKGIFLKLQAKTRTEVVVKINLIKY